MYRLAKDLNLVISCPIPTLLNLMISVLQSLSFLVCVAQHHIDWMNRDQAEKNPAFLFLQLSRWEWNYLFYPLLHSPTNKGRKKKHLSVPFFFVLEKGILSSHFFTVSFKHSNGNTRKWTSYEVLFSTVEWKCTSIHFWIGKNHTGITFVVPLLTSLCSCCLSFSVVAVNLTFLPFPWGFPLDGVEISGDLSP